MASAITDWQHMVVPEEYIPPIDLPEGWAAMPSNEGIWQPVGVTYDVEQKTTMVLWRRLLIITLDPEYDPDEEELPGEAAPEDPDQPPPNPWN